MAKDKTTCEDCGTEYEVGRAPRRVLPGDEGKEAHARQL